MGNTNLERTTELHSGRITVRLEMLQSSRFLFIFSLAGETLFYEKLLAVQRFFFFCFSLGDSGAQEFHKWAR